LSIRIIRWLARAWTIASIGLVLLFIVGDGSMPGTFVQWLGFLFFPVGISVGMVVAWWRERLGGSITVASLVAFYAIHLATAGTLPRGWAWLAVAAPGFLFLLCASRDASTKTA
jgi:hypothetical protein